MTDALRDEFLHVLTVDSETNDRRRKDFNQALFDPNEGWAVWSSTSLDMVLAAFDKAVSRVQSRRGDS